MAATSEDIERLLATMEESVISCPKCGGNDANICLPYYRLHPVRFGLGRTITLGYGDDEADCPETECTPKLHCHTCSHTWDLPTPRDKLVWSETVECVCEETQRLAQVAAYVERSAAGVNCVACGQPATYTPPNETARHGVWGHSADGQHRCPNSNPATYLKLPPT